MKDTLNVFISGSKRLQDHRMRLKALANNINVENKLKGNQVVINMISYINLGDSQKDYDDFINNKSDVIIFLIEDKIGDVTKKEFLLAQEARKRTGTPRIYIFMKQFSERTPEIEYVEQIVNANNDSYYIEYSNLDDLEKKVRARLTREVSNVRKKRNKKMKLYLKIWRLVAIIAIFLCLFSVVVFNIVTRANKDTVKLMFCGGGSAMHCLESYESVGSLYDHENFIVLDGSTKSSWSMVSGDLIHQNSIRGDKKSTLYYPISMSSIKAVDSNFLLMSNKKHFTDRGSVLALHIGEDTLTIYVKKSYENRLIDGKRNICAKDLVLLLQKMADNEYMIFTTQKGSGTLNCFNNALSPYDFNINSSTLEKCISRYDCNTPRSIIKNEGQPYVILGSTYYTANEVLEEDDCRPITVFDEKGNPIVKPLYLYFAGYLTDGGNSYCIPKEMSVFLKQLDPRFGQVIKNNKISRENVSVIVDLDEYLNSVDNNQK